MRHVAQANLPEIEIDFIAQNYYRIVFEWKVNCMCIFLVTIKRKYGSSSNTHFKKQKSIGFSYVHG